MGNPFIVLGPKGYLHNLKRLGFKTFGTFWNESYDDVSFVTGLAENLQFEYILIYNFL